MSALSAAEPDKTYTERLIDDALEQGDIQKATDLGKQGLKSTTSALATAGLLATGAGAFGALPADIVNTSFGLHGLYNAASKNGIRKTIRLAKEHDIPGAIQSGLGDALDLTMGLNTLRLGTRLGKSLIKGSSLGNAYRSDVAGRELANNIKQLNFIPAQVKYYGPTMGKSYAAKTNPNLIDLDTWGRPEYDKLAKKYGYKDWREMILSNKGDYNKEYKSLIKDQIYRIQSNPQYSGKTIIVSNASLLNPGSRITFANIPTIPDRAIMAERNHVRHPWESIEHGESWWDSLQSKGTPLKIDNRFVSEIEGNKTINFIPKQDLTHMYHYDPRVKLLSKPISEAEKLGIPKSLRSDSRALEDPYYWGYQQWNQRYNTAVESGNVEEAQRLRDLHFRNKTPNNKIIDYTGNPHKVYHGSPEDWYIFDDSKRGVDDVIYFSTDKAYADQYTIPRNQWQKGMIPTRSSRVFYLYGKEPINVGSDMYYGSVQDELIHNWANDLNADSVYGLDAITNPLNPSSGIEFGVLRRNQFKLSNPITKTNAGEIIPIVKRDNFYNPDIRYKQGGTL